MPERSFPPKLRSLGPDNGLAGVVSCAGIDACGRLEDVPFDAWERVIRVNLIGTAALVRAALPHFPADGTGRIVTVASTLGIRALSDASAYCASKFGVVGFTRAIAVELRGRVGVTCLLPGGMATGFFDGRDERYKPPADAQLNSPSHVAAAVAFALSTARLRSSRAADYAVTRELVAVTAKACSQGVAVTR